MSIFVKYSISDVWQGSKCTSVIFSRFFHTLRLTFTCYFQKSTIEKWYFSNHVVCLVCQKQTDFNSQNDIFSYSLLKNFKFSVWRNVCITIFLFGVSLDYHITILFQKQPCSGVLRKRCSENLQQIYRRTPMPKYDFTKVVKQLYWNHTSAWVFSCKFNAYFQSTFSWD